AFLRGEDAKEAETRLNQLLKSKPDQTAPLMSLGEIYLARQAWKECVAAYRQVLDKEPGDFVAGNNLAFILGVHLNKPAEGLDLLRSVSKGKYSGRALPGDRLHPEVLDTLGTIYQKMPDAGQDLHREMSEIFELAHKRYPRDARMYFYLGPACANLNETAKAGQLYQSALAIATDKENRSMTQDQKDQVIREVNLAKKRLPPK